MRCFVAVELLEENVSALSSLQSEARKLGLEASFPSRENLHLTLAFLGEKSEGEVARIVSSLREITFKPFPLRVEGTRFLPSDEFARVFYAGVAPSKQLSQLQSRISQATGVAEERPFHPHVTLARIRGRKNIASLVALKQRSEKTFFGETLVSKFFLKKSVLSPKGAVYEDIAVFPSFPAQASK